MFFNWCLMRHYGIPGKFILIIKNSYDRMICKVLQLVDCQYWSQAMLFDGTAFVSTYYSLDYEGNNSRTAKWDQVELGGATR